MKYIVLKMGVQKPVVYAKQQPSGDVFWVAGQKNATRFNKTKANQLARKEKGMVGTVFS